MSNYLIKDAGRVIGVWPDLTSAVRAYFIMSASYVPSVYIVKESN